MSVPEIFDRRALRLRRDRAAPRFAAHDFLRAQMIDELVERLDAVKRDFAHALDLGAADGALAEALRGRGIAVTCADPGHRFARICGGVQADEDNLPFADASFDLVMSAGGLESVNDLPGALTLIRRVLKPDGLFLGAMIGAGSLPALRAAALDADMAAGGPTVARFHPLVDVRAAGDLLARAGFALPVADATPLGVRYADLGGLIGDLRGMALTNVLAGRRMPVGRDWVTAASAAFAARADRDGRVTERFELLCLTGWSPGPDQPRPARRGSGQMSLANALKPPR